MNIPLPWTRSETFQEKEERLRIKLLAEQFAKHAKACAANRKKRKEKKHGRP